jgi:hypothetical protein
MSSPVRTDLKAQIKELLHKGLSRREIAEALGVTKNTVIGQVTRMKEKGELEGFEDNASLLKTIAAKRKKYAENVVRRAKLEAARLLKPKKVSVPKLTLVVPTPEPIEPSDTTKVGIYLCETVTNSCRFPVGRHDDQHTFCGKPSCSVKKPYCEEHYKVVWVKPSGSKRSLFKRIGFNTNVRTMK